MKGEIKVFSKPGKGSKFIIELPVTVQLNKIDVTTK
jgi:chemotaxis protein histidine kinase CheA